MAELFWQRVSPETELEFLLIHAGVGFYQISVFCCTLTAAAEADSVHKWEMKRKDSRGKGLSCANHAKAEARVPGKRDVLTRDSRGTSGTWNTQNPRGSRGMHSNQASTGLQPEAGFSLGSRQLCSQREGGRDTEEQRNACNPPLHTCTSEGANASSRVSPAMLRPCLLATMIPCSWSAESAPAFFPLQFCALQ